MRIAFFRDPIGHTGAGSTPYELYHSIDRGTNGVSSYGRHKFDGARGGIQVSKRLSDAGRRLSGQGSD